MSVTEEKGKKPRKGVSIIIQTTDYLFRNIISYSLLRVKETKLYEPLLNSTVFGAQFSHLVPWKEGSRRNQVEKG